MAFGINKVMLAGRLGKDPEKRGDREFAVFSLATSRSYKKGNEKVEETEWHNVVVFNEHAAKFALQYCKKGDLVYLEGRVATRKYEKDGSEKYITEIIVPPYEGVLQKISSPSGSDRSDSRSDDRRDDSVSGRGDYSGRPDFRRDLDDEIPF